MYIFSNLSVNECKKVTYKISEIQHTCDLYFNNWREQTLTNLSTLLYAKAKDRCVTSGDFQKVLLMCHHVSDCYDNLNNLN